MTPITIDIVSDVICPWCFLGKRRLDKALAGLAGTETEIRWRPFLLDASIPKAGLDRREYLTRKFGAERLATIHDPLKAAGDAEGVPYRFEKITRTPNTLDAHRLLRWSSEAGCQHEMAERLFQLYWTEGADIGNRDVLLKAAVELGLDRKAIAARLSADDDRDVVMAEIRNVAELGITGVPTFIFAGRYAVVGAQPADVLKGAIVRASLEARQSGPVANGQ